MILRSPMRLRSKGQRLLHRREPLSQALIWVYLGEAGHILPLFNPLIICLDIRDIRDAIVVPILLVNLELLDYGLSFSLHRTQPLCHFFAYVNSGD